MKGFVIFFYIFVGLGCGWSIDEGLIKSGRKDDVGLRVFAAATSITAWPLYVGRKLVRE